MTAVWVQVERELERRRISAQKVVFDPFSFFGGLVIADARLHSDGSCCEQSRKENEHKQTLKMLKDLETCYRSVRGNHGRCVGARH